MLITKTSMLSGKEHTLDIPCSKSQLHDYEKGLALIQDIFPELTADQREFLMTGITPDEWEAEFGEEEDAGDEPAF